MWRVTWTGAREVWLPVSSLRPLPWPRSGCRWTDCFLWLPIGVLQSPFDRQATRDVSREMAPERCDFLLVVFVPWPDVGGRILPLPHVGRERAHAARPPRHFPGHGSTSQPLLRQLVAQHLPRRQTVRRPVLRRDVPTGRPSSVHRRDVPSGRLSSVHRRDVPTGRRSSVEMYRQVLRPPSSVEMYRQAVCPASRCTVRSSVLRRDVPTGRLSCVEMYRQVVRPPSSVEMYRQAVCPASRCTDRSCWQAAG